MSPSWNMKLILIAERQEGYMFKQIISPEIIKLNELESFLAEWECKL